MVLEELLRRLRHSGSAIVDSIFAWDCLNDTMINHSAVAALDWREGSRNPMKISEQVHEMHKGLHSFNLFMETNHQ